MAFKDEQELPLRPITLLYGPNSSGKSSIIQSLLLLSHGLRGGSIDTACVRAAPDAPDLGGLHHFSHNNNWRTDVKISLQLQAGDWSGCKAAAESELGVGGVAKTATRGMDVLLSATDVLDCAFKLGTGFDFSINGELLVAFGKNIKEADLSPWVPRPSAGFPEVRNPAPPPTFPDGRNLVPTHDPFSENYEELRCIAERVELDHSAVRRWISQWYEIATKKNLSPGVWSSACKAARKTLFLSASLDGILPSTVGWRTAFMPGKAVRGEDENNPLSEDVRRVLALFEEFVYRLIYAVRVRLSDLIEALVYLGPLRSYSGRRVMNLSPAAESVEAGGDVLSSALVADPELLMQVNQWMQERLGLLTPYRLLIRQFFESEKIRKSFKRDLREFQRAGFSAKWFLKGFFQRHGVLLEIALQDVRSKVLLSQRDVGVGISQILPILITALGTRNRWHLVEQPELHLHPAHQAELAELFIESALGDRGNRFVIETHSEHLLLRIMKRIREQAAGTARPDAPAISHNDISVVYVEPTKNGSLIRHMPLNARGELVNDWPGGFFEEGLRELLI